HRLTFCRFLDVKGVCVCCGENGISLHLFFQSEDLRLDVEIWRFIIVINKLHKGDGPWISSISLYERFACHFKACNLWDVSYLAVCQNQSELTTPSSVT